MGLDPKRLVSGAATDGGRPAFELWPEHISAFEVFGACLRQWRIITVGMGGAYYQGLDLSAVDVAMRRLGVPVAQEREVLLQVLVMESEGVDVMNA